MVVRPIAPDEHARLGAITVAAYRALDGVLDAGYERELADVGAKVAAGAEVVVALDEDGTVVGGLCFVADPANPYAEHDDPDATSFRHLAVDPRVQARGAGRSLVAWAIARTRELGRHRIVIHSTPWMTRAHGLYERSGFRRAPQLDWAPEPDVPLLGFVLDLTGRDPIAHDTGARR